MSETIKNVDLTVTHPWGDSGVYVGRFDGLEAARSQIAKMREAYRVLGFGDAPDVIFNVRFKGSDIAPADQPAA